MPRRPGQRKRRTESPEERNRIAQGIENLQAVSDEQRRRSSARGGEQAKAYYAARRQRLRRKVETYLQQLPHDATRSKRATAKTIVEL